MKKLLTALIALTAMFIIGCGGAALVDAPEITGVVMTATSVKITWTVDATIEGNADFSGYNVYAYTDSADLLAADGENLNAVNATVIADTNTYTITGLSQDSIYYIQVRTVNTDSKVGDHNATVPFIKASPRPEFIKTVYMEWVNGDTSDCAIHFSTGVMKMRDSISTTWGDMWVDHAVFTSVDSVWLQSAYKADTTAGYRDTKLDNLGPFDFDEVWEATTPTLRTEPIAQGDLIVAKTVEGNFVKIHVDSLYFNATDAYGWAKLTYAYQNIVNFPYFSGQR